MPANQVTYLKALLHVIPENYVMKPTSITRLVICSYSVALLMICNSLNMYSPVCIINMYSHDVYM